MSQVFMVKRIGEKGPVLFILDCICPGRGKINQIIIKKLIIPKRILIIY